MIVCQQNRINNLFFLQHVRVNRQPNNNKNLFKICNLIYLKAVTGQMTIDIYKNNVNLSPVSVLMMITSIRKGEG